MSDYSLQDLNISPVGFLGAFFSPAENVCIRIFSDRPGSAFSGLKMDCKQGRLEQSNEILKQHNEQNRGIFFVINFGGCLCQQKSVANINEKM